jgi:hypothetical protein
VEGAGEWQSKELKQNQLSGAWLENAGDHMEKFACNSSECEENWSFKLLLKEMINKLFLGV